MKKVKLFLSLAISLLTIVGLTSKAHAVTHYVQFSTPTIFVHGWGNSSHAEEKMANAARDAGVTKIIVRANVDKNGKVTFNRRILANTANLIVEVNLEDNKLANYQNNYAKRYHHGGVSVKNVVVAHLVAIAGHYNVLVGESDADAKVDAQTGEPEQKESAYRELLGLRQTFPKNTAVLNIYGDVEDGSHSDEDVPVNSAKSLKYLVASRAKSY